ncbi:MAG: penicillin-binding protein 2 [Candidatus Paceibacterota bacterium]
MKPNLTIIRFIFSFILLCVFVLVFRLYVIQVVDAEKYSASADQQQKKPTSHLFNRGTISFSKKDGGLVSAATLQSGYIVAINPQILKNPEEVYEKLSSIVPDIDRDTFLAKANKVNDPYEEILKRVNSETGEKIKNLKITGLNIFNDKWRIYPGESMSAHVLGIVAYKGDELAGRYGLERYYEDNLKKDNQVSYRNFFVGIFSSIKDGLSGVAKYEGDIVTTIEPIVEAFFESELEQINKKWSSDYTGGIIIDPKTGEIIAMAMYPTFNPNSFQEEKNSAIFSNPLVENVYEMGSIIKPLTVSAGLDSGSITPDTTYFDTGSMTLNNKTFSNYDGKGRGLISMQEVLNQSLNTGAAFVVQKMGKENFSKYMFGFGLGEKTGIDLPNEAMNLVDNLKSPRDIEHATASFGQGIALTPIATVRALSSLANGGVLIYPHIVKEIKYTTGLSKKISPEPGRRVLKPETAEAISKMLVKTVDTSIIEGKIKIPNYSVAAKTGTAQIAKEGGGGYYDDRFLHSFFGYFPAYDPRFLVFLYTYHPKGIRFSSETLPVPFMNIAKFLINYYEIPPDR